MFYEQHVSWRNISPHIWFVSQHNLFSHDKICWIQITETPADHLCFVGHSVGELAPPWGSEVLPAVRPSVIGQGIGSLASDGTACLSPSHSPPRPVTKHRICLLMPTYSKDTYKDTFRWCFMQYSRKLHLYHDDQHYGAREPTDPRAKPTTICRLLAGFPWKDQERLQSPGVI